MTLLRREGSGDAGLPRGIRLDNLVEREREGGERGREREGGRAHVDKTPGGVLTSTFVFR